MPVDRSTLVPALQNIATRLRIDSARSTSEAGSGHPTSCFSAAEAVAALFFAEMRFDPKNPQHPGSDRFVLSKGHAAPVLYAAWAEAGAGNPTAALRWLDRLTPDQLARDQQAKDIKELALDALAREPAPPPRPVK